MASTLKQYGRVGLVALVVLALVYGVLVAEILLALLIVLVGAFLYLFWRLVRAHERLAAAMDGERDEPPEDESDEDGDQPTTADPPIEEP